MLKKLDAKNAIVALCSLVYFVSYFSRKDFAAVMVAMLAENVLDKSEAGLVGTMLFAFYGAGQLVSGYLGDKIKPKYLLISGLFATALFNLLMPIVPSSILMIFVWAGNGFAQAMLWPPIVKILSENLNHERYVTANLIVTSAAHVSTILLYLYVPICLEFMDWQTVFYTSSLLALLAMIIFTVAMHFVVTKEGADKRNKQSAEFSQQTVYSSVSSSGLLFIFVCIITCGFLRDGIESWLPTLYSEAFSRDSSESILVSVILPIFSIITISLIKVLHKKSLFNNEVRGSAILFIISVGLSVPLAILMSFDGFIVRVVCLVLAALICSAMHGVNFLFISCLPGRFAKMGRASTISGLTNACIYIGAAISMYGIAIITENFGWSLTVVSWIGVALVGVVFCIPAYPKYKKFIE